MVRRLGGFVVVALCLATLLAPSVAGAAPTVEVGPPYRVVDAAEKTYCLVGGEIVALKWDGLEEYTAQRYDPATLTQRSVVPSVVPGGGQVESVLAVGGHLYLFYSVWDRKAEREQLYLSTFDAATGDFARQGRPLLAVDGKVVGTLASTGYLQFAQAGKFRTQVSSDGRRVMVSYRRKPAVRDDSTSFDRIGVLVLDDQLAEAWRGEYRMPYTEEKMDFLDAAVDRDGTGWLLAKVREGSGAVEVKDGQPNYHIEALRLARGTDRVDTRAVTLGRGFVRDALLYDAGSAGLLVGGTYTGGTDRWGVDGFFTANVAAPGGDAPLAATFHPIPTEMLAQFASARERRRAEKKGDDAELPFLTIRRLWTEPDGSITFLAEQTYVVVHIQTNSSGAQTRTYDYHFDDLLLARLGGEKPWMFRVPKLQLGRRNPGGLSVATRREGDRLDVLYFDNVANLDLPPDREPTLHVDGRGGFLTALVVDVATGEHHLASLFDASNVAGLELFQVGADRVLGVGAGTYVMEAYKKNKEDVLLRVHVE